jgi:choline dehydrogenase-like flavoprotein
MHSGTPAHPAASIAAPDEGAVSAATPPDASRPLTSRQRATLDAVARRVVPHAYASRSADDVRADVAALAEARLSTMPEALVREVALALDLIGGRAASLLWLGRPVRFVDLDPALQDRLLEAWATSRLGPPKTIYQALRRLTLLVYYSQPRVQREIGYLGPLHSRSPVLPWEGPAARRVPSPAPDAEPIAREGDIGLAARLAEARDEVAWRARHPLPRGVVRGHEIAGQTHLTADVVVIGTGAGGAVAAARLADAGREVVLLEEGSWVGPGDFSEREAEMSERLYADGGTRATSDQSIPILQGATVGGGTTVNWLIMLRAPDFVLEEWAEHHGAVGMGPRDLAPVFERIEREVHARRVPDDAHSPNNRLILDGAAALGWRASTGAINTRGCVRSGFCGQGCRYDAKQGAMAVYLPRALAAGARLFADACATRIERIEPGGRRARKRVTATVIDPRTRRPRATITIDAPTVILAAGAVGTPALLQRSGLGGGGVGHWLRLHPTTAVLGDYEREIQGGTGIPLSVMCDEFARRDGRGFGFWIECPPIHPALGATAINGFGHAHRAIMERYRHLGAMIALVRDGADRDRSSGSVRVDRAGRVHIDYRLMPADRAHLIEAIEAAARLHLAAGAREAITLHARPVRVRDERDLAAIRSRRHGPNDVGVFSAHVNGTCRLGTDPRTSGTTPDAERHGAPGIFVCDGSLLPTSLGVNPQETIMALASIVAERIDALTSRG